MANRRSKPVIPIAADSPAPVAYARVLRAYTRALRRQERAVLTVGNDIAVHDFRVLLRALRSLFKAAKKDFDDETRQHFRTEFRWLTQRTAPVRDLDVLHGALPAYLAHEPALAGQVTATITPLIARMRAAYYADLREALRGPRYRALLRDWHTALVTLGARHEAPPIAERVARALARHHRTLRGYRRRDLKELATLHALRKDCKALRYLMEAFSALFEPASHKNAVEACKQLQSICGDYWDIEVHARLLDSLLPRAEPALAKDARRALRHGLTTAARTGSTPVMNAIREFRNDFELPMMRNAPARSPQ